MIVLFLKQISIAALVATPLSLVIIQSNEKGDNPWRHPPTILKCLAAWWVGLAGTTLLSGLFSAFGPILGMMFMTALMGWIFDQLFEQGFWRGCWWTILTSGLAVVLLVGGSFLYLLAQRVVL